MVDRRPNSTIISSLVIFSSLIVCQHIGAVSLENLPRYGATKCSPSCTDYGNCNEELGRCDCPRNMTGDNCSQPLEGSALEAACTYQLYPSTKECLREEQACLNRCNRRGKCIAGFCHCWEGHYGGDCALSIGEDGTQELLRGTGYKTREKRPHVYVYELPLNLTTGVNMKRLDRPTHNLILSRLLSSGARIADGDKADWFFIAVRRRAMYDTYFLMEAIKYIRQTWPWWDKYGGGRHVVVHTGDLGAQETTGEDMHITENMTWLTHWGLTKDNKFSQWKKAHRVGKDIVIPVYISPGHYKHFGFHQTPLHPKQKAQWTRDGTLFFAGRICGDRKSPNISVGWPHCGGDLAYSTAVRQKVHWFHHNQSGFRVVSFDKHYGDQLMKYKFCLAPLGGGHGQRQILVSFMGCIPVTIGDNVMQPFEPELDWTKFGVQPLEEDIPNLPKILEAFDDGQVEKMQRALACAAQHMAYSTTTGGFMGETGAYDAFETILEILRIKILYPDAAPSDYASLDADFNRFMNCGAEELGVAGVPEAPQKPRQLCSHSEFDAHPPECYKCLLGIHPSFGVAGGAICCNRDGTREGTFAKRHCNSSDPDTQTGGPGDFCAFGPC
eukprot:gene13328-19166_t